MEYIGPIILQIVLIALNAIFASAEIAVVTMGETKIEKLAEEGNKKAKKLKKLTKNQSKFLATIQVAITLACFLGSAFAAESFSLSASHYEPHYLTAFKHDFELVPQKETTVIIDYRTSGIGSNSCGPALNEKYRISEKEFDFEFSVKPENIGNHLPEVEYSILTK